MTESRKISYFVSPHGFGHAARASSVMEALYAVQPDVSFDIFTTVPVWFFEESLTAPFTYHPLMTDVGLAQKTPFQEDISTTVQRLDDFLPFDQKLIDDIAKKLQNLGCRLVICDIAPMGIVVARQAGIPSVLIENFTWDWIYQGYVGRNEGMGRHIDYLQNVFRSADHHVQAEPVCNNSDADLVTLPVCRKSNTPRGEIRTQLGIPDGGKMVMITTGGVQADIDISKMLHGQSSTYFVLPGGSETTQTADHVILLPNRSEFFHPDLVSASDGVVGKLGYSTLAEVYQAGVPFGYITRPDFREAEILARFVEGRMTGLAIDPREFYSGNWLSKIPKLLELESAPPSGPNGSDQITHYICRLLNG